MVCRRYLFGMFCFGLGVGLIFGRLIPTTFFVLLCGAGLIALGVILLAR